MRTPSACGIIVRENLYATIFISILCGIKRVNKTDRPTPIYCSSLKDIIEKKKSNRDTNRCSSRIYRDENLVKFARIYFNRYGDNVMI